MKYSRSSIFYLFPVKNYEGLICLRVLRSMASSDCHFQPEFTQSNFALRSPDGRCL